MRDRRMIVTVRREAILGDRIESEYFVNGQWTGVALERTARAIPVGRYQIVLTASDRAKRGLLWSPRENHVLPLLLNVPDHDGIRIVAMDRVDDLDGCLAVGVRRVGDMIEESRIALIALMAKLDAALALRETLWCDVTGTV